MFEYYRFLFAVLLIAGLGLVASCGGEKAVAPKELAAVAFDDLRDQIAEVIDNAERRDTIVELANKLERDYGLLYDSKLERRDRLRALHANYGASREELLAVADELEAAMRDARKATGRTYGEFVLATTAQEWAAISKVNTKTIKAAIAALQSI